MASEKLEQAVHTLEENKGEIEIKELTFGLDKQLFGIPVANVVQIVGIQPITKIPGFPAYCKGIINLEGSDIPLIGLRFRFGKAETEYTERTCIIGGNMGGKGFGDIVDGVDKAVNIPGGLISLPPQRGDYMLNRYLTGIARLSRTVPTKLYC